MNLAYDTLGNEPKDIDLEAEASELPELSEAGGVGKVRVQLEVSPLAGDAHLVRGLARGGLSLDCGRCLEKLEQPFKTQFNLLIEKRKEKGLEWSDNEEQGIEDYQVRIGPDIMDIPLDAIIVEQVLLNYNLHPLPALDAKNCCVQCGKQAPTVGGVKKKDRVDPRWGALKALAEVPEKKAPKGSDSGKKRGKA
jgi:uncharacterized metal-binding protein YceD (DUF177 family)